MGRHKRHSGTSSPVADPAQRHQQDKVGSSHQAAAKEPGGAHDFGIPARQATMDSFPGGRAKGPDAGTGPMRSDAEGRRTVGVGAPPGSDGAGSGGDVDTDVIGLDGRGGIAGDPTERRSVGPDITQGESDAFASGPPAAGHAAPAKKQPLSDRPAFDTVDHSGGDVTTSGDESSPTTNPEIDEIKEESDQEDEAIDQSEHGRR